MHERTRRQICQLVFVVACALPTLLTVSTVLVRNTPWFDNWRRERLETELCDRFGLRFEIGQMKVLAPGAMQLERVNVTDPETGADIGSIRVVQFTTRDGRLALRLAQPEVRASQLPHAWHLLHDRFLCHPELTTHPVRIAADDLSILSTGGGITLTDLQAYVQPHDYANETIMQFKIAGREMPSPATISITRDRSRRFPETAWKMHTGGTPLPYSLLSDYFPQLPKLGNSCEFNGPISCRLSRDGWNVDLGGSSITGIEVSRVFDNLAHKLTGTADVWLGKCRIEEGLLVGIAGGMTVRNGQIGDSLLQSANALLGVQSLVANNRPSHPFDLMQFRFAMDDAGWQFIGACEAQNRNLQPGILALQANHPIALLSTPQPLGISIPKQLVAPEYSKPVFAGETNNLVLDLLPSPPAQPPYMNSPMVPRVTMRSQD
ncbi:hypothetical protein EC9_09430 [Rosistilla ulvae]|uniref:AsmA-like C-terminal domain-containing protein n=1 Tax=Rosistilla ulvae TaxID=1930277 RepID=A0A517LVZ3_9BACT|nr:hypothetical protein [Rosistilla ulvae]QDS86769.1 hypothetical protein EC9_09430 [Rosistilla ulvae]